MATNGVAHPWADAKNQSDAVDFTEREQFLLEGLRSRYNAVLFNRRRYFDLLCFLAFTVMYMAILGLQRRSFMGFDINQSFAHLVPVTDQGDVAQQFNNPQELYDWMNGTVDCGWRTDLVRVEVQLEYKFQDPQKKDMQGACNIATLNTPGAEGCYFKQKSPFRFFEGQFMAVLFLPSETQWVYCLETPPPILSVSGQITGVSMTDADRLRRSRDRQGFLGSEQPQESNLDAIFRQGQATTYLVEPRFPPPPGRLPPSKGGPVVRQLVFWDYSRKESPCQHDCSLLSACAWRCPGTRGFNTTQRLQASQAIMADCLARLNCSANEQTRLPVNPQDTKTWDCRDYPTADCVLLNCGVVDGLYQPCPISNDVNALTQECAPRCPFVYAGDGSCDLACATSPACGYDFTDCCEEHVHVDGEHHFHCPSNRNRFGVDSRLVVIDFHVPYYHPSPWLEGALREQPQAPPPSAGNATHPHEQVDHSHPNLLGRWVGTRNKVIAGILIHQNRAEEPAASSVDHSRFANLNASLTRHDGHMSVEPYGRNPVFLQSSSLYMPQAVGLTGDLFQQDELIPASGVPYGFFALPGVSGYQDGFPVFLDASYSLRRVMEELAFMMDGSFIDHHTTHISIQLVAYNAELERFGTLIVHTYFEAGGVIVIHPQIEIFSVEMYNSPGDKARAAFEVLFVVLVVIAMFIELGQMLAIYHATGSIMPYLNSFWNIVDLTSITLMYTIIAM
eukprot:jgi/Mesvir1/25999/Mv20965-RA.1